MSKLLPLLPSSTTPRAPLSAEDAVDLAAAFKALGDPVRLRLVSLIAAHDGGEACVCDLTGAFDLTGPTISHHLKVLRLAGLITGERRGTWIYYRIQTEVIGHLAELLAPTTAPLAPTCTPEEGDLPE
ncbi:metalloregulator ArsR/SmtB family transcription factor [Pseudonocardia xishanensis]|uniref:Metalloregulator ArsR/SmtB family transcription factor n=1 Tax=Pseudonocardia xishanensis TaxID=630995 RepID=A0ABP8RRH7_9PSEU